MARFSISGYDDNGKCKICGSHVSEMHNEGCELGAVYAERKEMRLVIEQFLKLLGVETITSAFSKIAAEQSVHWTLPMCSVCGESVARKSGMCEDCEMLARQSQ